MKINLKELSDKAIESTTGQKKMRLSENASSMVFQLFTKNVYSNPIGTVVREITSNCFDSHVEAGINAPVRIKKFKDATTNTTYISFIDYGVGMSPDRVENIYGVYFESTKRVDNTQIGGFGIGGKTPLAYKRSIGNGDNEYDNSFFVITTYNGVKYFYCIYEGTESPIISLLYEEETTEGNGTEVRIPVLEKDIESFAREMVKQLYYFENIIFEGFEDTYQATTLTNDYQIIKGDTFLFRVDNYENKIHVCLGRVAYPINYGVLGLNSSDYTIPIALKLNVGDVNVTVSRENIDYSDSTIKMLKTKLTQAVDEIKTLLVKQYDTTVTLEQYFTVKSDFGRLYFSNGQSMYIGNSLSTEDINFKKFRFNNILSIPNDRQLFQLFFNVTSYGNKPRRSRYGTKTEFEGGYKELKENKNVLNIEGDFQRKVAKQGYLKREYQLFHIIKKSNILSAIKIDDIQELFKTEVKSFFDDKGNLTPLMSNIIKLRDEYWEIVKKNTVNYDEFVVPEEYLEERKNMRKLITDDMRKLSIPIKYAGYCKERVKLDDLFKFKMPIFYGTQDDADKINTANDLFSLLFDRKFLVNGYNEYSRYGSIAGFTTNYNSGIATSLRKGKQLGGIMFIQVARGNVKYMEFCKNANHIDKFYEKMLYRKADFIRNYFSERLIIEQWNNLDDLYHNKNFTLLDTFWGKKINECKNYVSAIPSVYKNYEIAEKKHELKKYFDIDNMKPTPAQQLIIDKINDIQILQDNNSEYLNCLRSNFSEYYFNSESLVLIEILVKIMKF